MALSLTLFITVFTLAELDYIKIQTLRILAALATFLLFVNIYDWLRLFEQTAFYVKLVQETLKEARWFLLLVAIALIMFGLPMSFLALNNDDNESQLVGEYADWWLVDTLFNQYLLSLGEFDSKDNFTANPHTHLVLIFFLLATFYTQVTMINMLIAIMGDSFDKVTDNRDLYAMLTKLQIMSEQAPFFRAKDDGRVEQRVFMIVVKPNDGQVQDEGNDEWKGIVHSIESTSKKMTLNVRMEIEQKQE